MEKYDVTGMSCAACSARVEKAVTKVPGVTSCAVSLLTNSMGVEGTASAADIIKAVENAGYGAEIQKASSSACEDSSERTSIEGKANASSSANKDNEITKLVKRLCWSVFFLLILMYFSMGHTMWNFPLPTWFNGNHVAISLVQMIFAAIVMLINKKFFISGAKSVFHGSPNMDTLVAMGSGISFIYSTVVLFGMTDAVIAADNKKIMSLMHNLYFESAAMILTLITVGKLLEAISKGRTTDALKSLMKLAPKTAIILSDDVEKEVPVESVKPGDIFVVRPGQNIPVDGFIIEGNTSINESALTGESIPVDKGADSSVSAATINISGYIKCRATRVGKDTTLSQIIQMVSDAAATKAPIAKIADKVSGIFVPAVILIAAVTFTIWLILGAELPFALSHAIAVLVVSCPCALGLATPVAIMVGNGVGAKKGILFKTSAALENAGRTQIVVLDKTGTITKGEPVVTDIVPADNCGATELLYKAYALESKSEHPLAKAVVIEAKKQNAKIPEIDDFEAVIGSGVRGKLVDGGNEIELYGGKIDYIKKITEIPDALSAKIEELCSVGKTPLVFAENIKKDEKKTVRILGLIAVADVIKEDSPEAISELARLNIKTVMLTGDNEKTANAIGQKAGVSKIISGVLPDAKAENIKKLKKIGKVMMVGDGINDAPALTTADAGVAIGAGTDVAIDAADIVLMKSKLSDVVTAIRLSRSTLKNIHENLFWAFFYNIILIPIAAGAYHHAFGLDMNPMLGAAAMSLSSFCVVTNALRLNFFRVKNKRVSAVVKQSENKNKINEESDMKKTIKVNGMMCEHCEAHVKEALEKIDGVECAVANHKKGKVVITMTKDVEKDALKNAVTDAGYDFVG